MTGLRTPSRPAPWMTRPVFLGVVALAVFAAVLGVSVSSLTRGPAFVERITMENPTPYNLQVVVGAPGDEALDLGTVPREGSRTFEQVPDQGESWVFALSFGQGVGEVVVQRQQLETDRWRVTIPAGIGQELGNAGYPPSAI